MDESLYYYRYRAGSAYRSVFTKKNFDEIRALEQILTLIDDEPVNKTDFRAKVAQICKINLIKAIIVHYPDRQSLRAIYYKTLKYCGSIIKSKGIPFHSKLAYLIFLGCPLYYAKLYDAYTKKIRMIIT